MSKVVHIRSFVNFKLSKIIKIWKQISNYLNNNFTSNSQDELCLEFLKFIADNSSAKSDILYLQENQGNLELFDIKNNRLRSISKNDEIGILVSLILYSPKKLIINCIDSLSDKVSDLISYIFEDKVSVLY